MRCAGFQHSKGRIERGGVERGGGVTPGEDENSTKTINVRTAALRDEGKQHFFKQILKNL